MFEIMTGFIHVREMSEKCNFFQGQEILREFCDVSGENEILQNVREMSRILYFSQMKLGYFVPVCFLLNS